MALTEWHFVLLYADKICAVDLLTDKVVYHELLNLVRPVLAPFSSSSFGPNPFLARPQPDGARPLRLATDPVRKTLWMYTDQAIYELVVRDEDRNVWSVYLARGQWDNARRLAKVRPSSRSAARSCAGASR